jgi:hypothetical protein
LTQTIETLRTIRLSFDRQRIVKDVSYKLESNYKTTLELDSRVNTCVLGHDALIILDYQQPVSVMGYDKSLGSKNYQTVSGVVAYDDPWTGRTLHPIINQAIHIPHHSGQNGAILSAICTKWHLKLHQQRNFC